MKTIAHDIVPLYTIGQMVWPIWSGTLQVEKLCPMCLGKQEVEVNGIAGRCPHCYGNGYLHDYEPQAWRVGEPVYIELIRTEIAKKKGMHREVKYMEHGHGSGTVHDETRLFPSPAAAEEECAKRNANAVKAS